MCMLCAQDWTMNSLLLTSRRGRRPTQNDVILTILCGKLDAWTGMVPVRCRCSREFCPLEIRSPSWEINVGWKRMIQKRAPIESNLCTVCLIGGPNLLETDLLTGFDTCLSYSCIPAWDSTHLHDADTNIAQYYKLTLYSAFLDVASSRVCPNQLKNQTQRWQKKKKKKTKNKKRGFYY